MDLSILSWSGGPSDSFLLAEAHRLLDQAWQRDQAISKRRSLTTEAGAHGPSRPSVDHGPPLAQLVTGWLGGVSLRYAPFTVQLHRPDPRCHAHVGPGVSSAGVCKLYR